MPLPDLHSFQAVGGFQHIETIALEQGAHEFGYGVIILDHQDCFRPGAGNPGGRLGRSLRLLDSGVGWEINSKSGALPEHALDFNPAFVLFDDAIDGGQSQPCAFVDGLRREEGLKDAGLSRSIHPAARVRDTQANRAAGVGVGVPLHIGGVNFEHIRADG